MNGNPAKVEVTGDGWNGEDYSVVAVDASGNVTERLDQHVLDRIYPSAVAGDILAFATEDLASSDFAGGSAGGAWLTVPASGAVSISTEIGSTIAHELVLTSPGNAAGTVHVALVLDGAGLSPTADQLAMATQELIAWQSSQLP